jgi:hypothetical protein
MYWRLALWLVWLAFIFVGVMLHVPALIVVALIMGALQAIWIVLLAIQNKRRRS